MIDDPDIRWVVVGEISMRGGTYFHLRGYPPSGPPFDTIHWEPNPPGGCGPAEPPRLAA